MNHREGVQCEKNLFTWLAPIIVVLIFIALSYYEFTTYGRIQTNNIATFLTVLLTYAYVVLTNKMVRESQKKFAEEKRPYISVDFEFMDYVCYIIFKNYELSPAYDSKIYIEPNIDPFGISNEGINNTLLKKGFSFFPPNKTIQTAIGSASDLGDKYPEKYAVEISYIDSHGKEFRDEFHHDLSYKHHVLSTKSSNEKNIEDISKSLKEIDKNLTQITKVLYKR